MVESVFSIRTLELDLDDNREDLISTQPLQRDLAFWIEGDDNRTRRQATIGSHSPIDSHQRSVTCLLVPLVNS